MPIGSSPLPTRISRGGRLYCQESELLRYGVFETAFQFKFDLYRVVHLEEEVARILEAPIDERNAELRAARPMISGKFRFDGHGQFMFVAMQNKKSVHLNGKCPLRRNFPFHAVWSKNDFRVLPALENLLVHFLIA